MVQHLRELFAQERRNDGWRRFVGSQAMGVGVNYTAGLPVIRTSPAHGTAYDIAGKGLASEDSFRQAIYVAIDVFRNRLRDKAAHANPLRKQYYEKRDDSDKLKLDSVEEDL